MCLKALMLEISVLKAHQRRAPDAEHLANSSALHETKNCERQYACFIWLVINHDLVNSASSIIWMQIISVCRTGESLSSRFHNLERKCNSFCPNRIPKLQNREPIGNVLCLRLLRNTSQSMPITSCLSRVQIAWARTAGCSSVCSQKV